MLFSKLPITQCTAVNSGLFAFCPNSHLVPLRLTT